MVTVAFLSGIYAPTFLLRLIRKYSLLGEKNKVSCGFMDNGNGQVCRYWQISSLPDTDLIDFPQIVYN